MNLSLTQNAAKKINALIVAEKADGLMLRLSVSGGGCSGFQYHFSLDDQTTMDDKIFENHGAKVIIDEMSLQILDGSEVDYIEDMMGASFVIKNPNASSSCGCGNSFSI